MMALFLIVAKRRGQARTLLHHFFSSTCSRSVSLPLRRQTFMTLSAVNDHQKASMTEVATKGTGKKYNKRLGELFEKFKYRLQLLVIPM